MDLLLDKPSIANRRTLPSESHILFKETGLPFSQGSTCQDYCTALEQNAGCNMSTGDSVR